MSGQGAQVAATSGKAADPYAGESIVVVRSENIYAMAADGTGWRQRTMAARVQSEAAVKQLGVLGIPYAGASERVEIAYARVRRADGTVVDTPVSDALEMPDAVTQAAPFYSDLKQKQIPIRNLRVGDTLEWQAKIVRTKAEAPGEFWGQDSFLEDGVVLEQAIELRVPAGKAVTVWSPGHKAVESTSGGERVYRWTNSALKPTTGKEAEAAAEAKKKALWTVEQEVDFKEGRLPTIAWTTFPSWEAVGAWYRGLEGDRMVAGPEVKAKVAEVTAGKATEEEKVRAVYGYVATQIRYIGVAFGVGRYQPHRAAEVLENQYGDCKDKHTLLAAMLGALGLKADAVLIGAGLRFNASVPSPGAFNHLITRVQVAGQPVWLDTTAEVAPYRMLLAVIRDHAALVVPDAGVAKVERTPAELPFKPFQKLEAVGSLDKEGVSNSKMMLTLRGDDEVLIRAVLRQVAPAQYEQLVQNMMSGMGYGGTTSRAEFSHAEDTSEPLVVHFDYKREKAGGDWEHYRTIAQLAPLTMPAADEKDPPVREIPLGVKRVETSASSMKLPNGWSAEIPEASHERSAWATFDQTYRVEKGILYADRRVEYLAEKVPQVDWKQYKKFTDVLYAHNDLYVQLNRPKSELKQENSVKQNEDVPPAESNADKASKLIDAAYAAVAGNDVGAAIPLLDQAKSLNEGQPRLWSTYGYAAYRRLKWVDAAAAYEKELVRYPETYWVYRALAGAYMFDKKPGEAIGAAKRWVAVQPSEPQAGGMLVSLLMKQEDYQGAVEAGVAATAGLPEEKRADPGLRYLLATAELKAGMKEKACAGFAELLKKTDDPWMLNSAAYALAEQGEDLALADASTRAALAKLDAETKTWTLDENPATLKAKSSLLTATWDTMGWVLFKEKKESEAERYLRAAWKSTQQTAVGEHLGDALAARGDRLEAAKTYQLALATVVNYDEYGVRLPKETADETRLRGKIQALGGKPEGRSKGLPVPVESANALQKMRTIALGPAGGKEGTAEYKMLLGANGVERVAPVGEKEIAGGSDLIKKARLAGFWPEGSEARLVRLGVLNCHSGVCELVLEP